MLPHARAAPRVHETPPYTNTYGRAYDLTGPVRASEGSSTAIRGGNKDDRAPRYEPFLVHPDRRCVFPPCVQPRGGAPEQKRFTSSGAALILDINYTLSIGVAEFF